MGSYSYTCLKCLFDSGIPVFIIIVPKFIDFGKAHTLISAVINQINELRSEEEFSRLFEQTEFCVENNIDPNVKVKQRRQRTVSTRFKNCSVTSTIRQCEEIDNESKYTDFVFYPVIDSILVEMNRGMAIQF
jgi:hypothetical protein